MLQPGKLNHRVVIQRPVQSQSLTTGAMTTTWENVATVWAAIEPSSVREFTAASMEQSKISTRIIIRYRDDITDEMRLYHAAKHTYYDIHGVLTDKETGYEYITLPCSTGLKYK